MAEYRAGDWDAAVAVQPGGKIVVAGETTSATTGVGREQIVVARDNVNGTLDATFGSGGISLTAFAATAMVGVTDLDLAPDGTILVAGAVKTGTASDLALLRYTAAGTPDTAFGGTGTVTIDRVGEEIAYGASIQPDGRIVVAGSSKPTGSTQLDSLVGRFLPDGALDPSFRDGGLTVTSLSSGSDRFDDVALQPDGKIIAVGYGTTTQTNALVARFLGDPAPLHAKAGATIPSRQALTVAQARPDLSQAPGYWRARGADTSRPGHIDLVIADLGGTRLGEASGSTITLDDNAAGWGWNVGRGRKGSERMDLVSALVHEVGHLLGHDHPEGGVMAETLAPGTRLLTGARPAAHRPVLIPPDVAGHDGFSFTDHAVNHLRAWNRGARLASRD